MSSRALEAGEVEGEVQEETGARWVEGLLAPEGHVKVRNYRLAGAAGTRAYTPSGDAHTSPRCRKMVPRYEPPAALPPCHPPPQLLAYLHPSDAHLAALLRPPSRCAPHSASRPSSALDAADAEAWDYLQRSMLSPSPQLLSPSPQPLSSSPRPLSPSQTSHLQPLPSSSKFSSCPHSASFKSSSANPHILSDSGHVPETSQSASFYPQSRSPSPIHPRCSPDSLFLASHLPPYRSQDIQEIFGQETKSSSLVVKGDESWQDGAWPMPRSLAEELREARGEVESRVGQVKGEVGLVEAEWAGAVRRLDLLLEESRRLRGELHDIAEELQVGLARAGRGVAGARALSAQLADLQRLDQLVALLRGDMAPLASLRWPFRPTGAATNLVV